MTTPQRPDGAPPLTTRSDRVRRVRTLSGRSARRRAGRFVVEGPQGVREAVAAHAEALAAGRPPVVLELYAGPGLAVRHEGLLASARAAGLAVRAVGDDVLAAMADTVTPQGVLAVCGLVDVPLSAVLGPARGAPPRLVAVLAGVSDPGNAGTVIRAADAAGADAVVLGATSVDVHNPKCVRSTAGSLFHLPVVGGADLPQALGELRAAGLGVLAADGAGDVDLDDLQDRAQEGTGPLRDPVAWVFGNEAHGLGDDVLALADAVVRVPVHGRAESLNLATAATVCLYASARALRRR